ncbi:MAG TPA: hypothetical protein VN133_10695 [Humibacter sp.]|nr:hypothetical protein [Humibacter sp.]
MRWSWISLVLLILSAVGLGAGVGWWVHPGAGIAVGSIMVGLIALFYDDGKGR